MGRKLVAKVRQWAETAPAPEIPAGWKLSAWSCTDTAFGTSGFCVKLRFDLQRIEDGAVYCMERAFLPEDFLNRGDERMRVEVHRCFQDLGADVERDLARKLEPITV